MELEKEYEKELAGFQPILQDFIKDYAENEKTIKLSINEWLEKKLTQELPEKKAGEIHEMTEEIISTIQISEKNRASLAEAVSNGRSKESWFASTLKKSASAVPAYETIKNLEELDYALGAANEKMYQTIMNQNGTINQNPSLDGLIAEQYHAQTFNLNAKLKGSSYYAEALESNGKNSVDIVLKNTDNGKIVQKYQAKYYKDAKATEQAFKNGDYRGSRKLVPKEQQAEIGKKAYSVLESPDGVTSNPLSKEEAKRLQERAQSGNAESFDWNTFKPRELTEHIAAQAGCAAVCGAALGTGIYVADKLCSGERMETEEIVETALISGADAGVKAAAAGALKAAVEKDIVTLIPKAAGANVITGVAVAGIENVKVMCRVADGELSEEEGLEQMQQVTVSTVTGMAAAATGAEIGAEMGLLAGPIGATVGGVVGGMVGYAAGSKVGEKLLQGAKKLKEGAGKYIKNIKKAWEDMKVEEKSRVSLASVGHTFSNAVSSFCSGVSSFFGW